MGRSSREVEVAILAYRASPTPEQRTAILDASLGLALAVIYTKFSRLRWRDRHEEMLGEAVIGLDRAIDAWDPARGAWSSIAWQCAFSECVDYLRRTHPAIVRKSLLSRTQPGTLFLDAMPSWRVERVLEPVPPGIEAFELHDYVEALIEILGDSAGEVARGILAGWNYGELAKRDGVSRQAIEKRLRWAVKSRRTALEAA